MISCIILFITYTGIFNPHNHQNSSKLPNHLPQDVFIKKNYLKTQEFNSCSLLCACRVSNEQNHGMYQIISITMLIYKLQACKKQSQILERFSTNWKSSLQSSLVKTVSATLLQCIPLQASIAGALAELHISCYLPSTITLIIKMCMNTHI